jgi:signal transduction histidine kinase/ligand-binding sensor domain-containing protein
MKLPLKHCLFVFLLIISKAAVTQSHNVKFTLFTGANGISVGKISAMMRDKYGFLWLADQSNRCILRFDGNHITRYENDPQNLNSLGGYSPECLATDSSGNIWIGFYGTGLDKFDPTTNKFNHYRYHENNPESLSSDSVTSVLIDHLGNIWAGTNGGLNLLDEKTGRFKRYRHSNSDSTSLSCDTIRILYEDKAGAIWVGTGFEFDDRSLNGGLNLLHRSNGEFTRYMHDPKDARSLVANKVRAIFEDSYGNFWIGTNGDGLHTMDRSTGKFTRFAYNPSKPNQLSRTRTLGVWDNITFITEDADRHIWIGTFYNGLIRYDPVKRESVHYGSDDDKARAMNDAMSWSACATSDGLIWISTQNANLFKVDIYHTTIPFIQQGTIVTRFNEAGDSVLLLGTNQGLVYKNLHDSTTHDFLYQSNDSASISANFVTAILKDKQDNFWVGTNNGLNYFNLKTRKFIRYYPDSIKKVSPSNVILGLCKDYNANLWIVTYGGRLYTLNPGSGKLLNFKYDVDTSSSKSYPVALVSDKNNLWIGIYKTIGITKINLQTKKPSRYFSGSDISFIYKDGDGIIWAGTPGGLYRYNEESDYFKSTGQENPENNIVRGYAITEDKENNLWVATESGICMLNKKIDRVTHFGRNFGIDESVASYYRGASFTAQNGMIYLGEEGGYYAFSPEKLNVSLGEPRLYFTGFWLNNKQILTDSSGVLREPLTEAKEIRLNHDQSAFAFTTTSVDFRNALDKKIYYKLDNFDLDWRTAQAEDKITYFKVPPGSYTFRIKTPSGNSNGWVQKYIEVVVLPPWWATWRAYFIYGVLLFLLILSLHRFQKERVIKSEREKTRAKELAQAKEIELAYRELKTAQAQLIQQEKMASLGELTAGIAHEIQNPLNFVNNFSDINNDLIDEMNLELAKGNFEAGKVVATDIKQNLEKISYHGKRADAIVKGMLQHSRASSGKKELTVINALCDEHLRLAYHGMRAKDKSFNANFQTDFDKNIGKVNIVPQDIGRVILNLINNAFYTVNEKTKQHITGYEPTVTIVTKQLDSMIEIRVLDNGNGVSQGVLNKIFQPFFTTKPTGQGTGLGLSLAYDIIKAHGGEIKVETKENEGSTFIIQLPI